jgi:transcription antitermination factor NusG
LNLPPPARAHDHEFKAGDEVTFRSLLYAANLGTGKVVALEGRDRIVVEVDKLFGRSTRVVVPAAEIEAK